ncbi:HIG1 domain-containing protein [Aurantiacibacter sediminis]|uniref:HIG1 domain-containing protein n=1 Tax=Aurantiacibacter sediminis TaxID=2793064 RepID=A0ABS0N2V1_9SPHN|nr:HIG1 domain-containing protein [Aurantiacibacter sediminis]MBH5321581.1 HIG1 domain-containing protein [Aurantiacibacter sediminis]
MNTFLTIVIIFLSIMVVVSLVRGVIAFLQTTKVDLEKGGANSQELQMRQNKAMFARIKYQAAAVAVVVILLLVNS